MLSKSKAQTQKIAIRLAKKIISEGTRKNARVLALIGDLGAGKTTFNQGFIKSLGIKTHVPSPTFVIYRKYKIVTSDKRQATSFKNIYHFDLYRIQKPKEIIDLDFSAKGGPAYGWKKLMANPENIVLIEWPEKILKFLPKNTIKVFLSHSKKEKERNIKVISD